MKLLKEALVAIIAVSMLMTLSVPVYADGYIVRTTVETVTTTNGVVTGYSKETYDSPVQYSYPTTTYTAPTYTAPVYTTPTYTAPTTCNTTNNSSSSKWVPNWGPNYASEQAKYMNGHSCSNTSTPVACYTGRTIGDEARAQANDIKSYAADKGWNVSVSSDWGDCNCRYVEISISNRKHNKTYTQVTYLNNGSYYTYWETYGDHLSKDSVKSYIKDRQV